MSGLRVALVLESAPEERLQAMAGEIVGRFAFGVGALLTYVFFISSLS